MPQPKKPVDQLTQEEAAAELQRRGVDGPVVPVAMSLGAMVAIQWAATAPRELAGCVLINTSSTTMGSSRSGSSRKAA